MEIASIVRDNRPAELRCAGEYIRIIDTLTRTAVLLHCQHVMAKCPECLGNLRGNVFIGIELSHSSPCEPVPGNFHQNPCWVGPICGPCRSQFSIGHGGVKCLADFVWGNAKQ
jgi:hypothetical protein